MGYSSAEHEYLNEPTRRYNSEYVEELLSQIDDLQSEVNGLQSKVDELTEELEEKTGNLNDLETYTKRVEQLFMELKSDYESVCYRLNHR